MLIIAEIEANKSVGAGVTALNAVRAELATLYTTGTYTAFDAADFASGAIEDNGGANDQANLLYEIAEEKYTSLVGQMEVFNDFRRLKNPLGIAPKIGSDFPQRYLTPQAELDGNLNAPSPAGLFEPTEANK